jgi:hypothetical protein
MASGTQRASKNFSWCWWVGGTDADNGRVVKCYRDILDGVARGNGEFLIERCARSGTTFCGWLPRMKKSSLSRVINTKQNNAFNDPQHVAGSSNFRSARYLARFQSHRYTLQFLNLSSPINSFQRPSKLLESRDSGGIETTESGSVSDYTLFETIISDISYPEILASAVFNVIALYCFSLLWVCTYFPLYRQRSMSILKLPAPQCVISHPIVQTQTFIGII